MKSVIRFSLIIALLTTLSAGVSMGQDRPKTESDTLVVLWTSGDIEVAEKIVFMYVNYAKRAKMFEEVIFIIWGPSAKLLSENEELQKRVKQMQEMGIITEACIACARMYDVDDDLKELGVDVKGMGGQLSKYLKRDYNMLTF